MVYLCGGTSEMRGIFELLQNGSIWKCCRWCHHRARRGFGSREGPTPTLAAMSASLSIDTATLAKMRMPSFALLRRFCTGPLRWVWPWPK